MSCGVNKHIYNHDCAFHPENMSVLQTFGGARTFTVVHIVVILFHYNGCVHGSDFFE